MKRFICLLLVLLLFPLVSFADDLSAVVGVWLASELLTTGCPSMSYLYLAENHKSYFVIQSFKEDGPGLGRQFVGTWYISDDGTVVVQTGNNTQTILTLAGDYSLDQNMKIYCHTPTLTLQDVLAQLGY